MGLLEIQAKCRALLLYRMYVQGHKTGTNTANWMRMWNLLGRQGNPPQARQIPEKFTYLRNYAMDMAYVQWTGPGAPPPGWRKQIYGTLMEMTRAARRDDGVRITTLYPNTAWDTVWKNLDETWVTPEIRSTWFQVIHDLIPTNVRLARIRLCDNEICPRCGGRDTLIHRLTECHDAAAIWKWTRERLAMMMRTNPRYIPPEWTIRPDCTIWPPQRRGAILWLVAHMVHYCIHHRQKLTCADYADFLRRARWKAYRKARRSERVGNYLIVLDDAG